MHEKFGEVEALLFTNRVLIDDAARRIALGAEPIAGDANVVEELATHNAIRTVELGLELSGKPGLSRKNPLARHYRDVLCSRIHTPQNDTILVGVGKDGLGRRAPSRPGADRARRRWRGWVGRVARRARPE